MGPRPRGRLWLFGMAWPMLTTVLFDLDDTLHDDTLAFQSAARDVSLEVCTDNAVAPRALAQAFVEELESFWKRFDARKIAPGTNIRKMMWREALQRFNIDDDDLSERCAHLFERRRTAYYKLFPGAMTTLAELRRDNFRLALLTNGLTTTHREKIELLGLAPHFSAIFLSDEMGVSKPDPSAFLRACSELGSLPNETAMVGDRYDKDIAGALNVGMKAVWLNIRNEDLPQGAKPPHVTISDIAQVPSALRVLLSAE